MDYEWEWTDLPLPNHNGFLRRKKPKGVSQFFMLTHLTSEQEALIPDYCQKWESYSDSTQPLNREELSQAIQAAYREAKKASNINKNLTEPEIYFFDSPFALLPELLKRNKQHSIKPFPLYKILYDNISKYACANIDPDFYEQLKQLHAPQYSSVWQQIWTALEEQLLEHWEVMTVKYFGGEIVDSPTWLSHYAPLPSTWTTAASFLDFCINVLKRPALDPHWNIFYSLTTIGGWIIPFEEECLVCDRPVEIKIDEQKRLHSETSPAVFFADSTAIYAEHGIQNIYKGHRLPEKYATVAPSQWQPEWVYTEAEPELRDLLVAEIGSEKLLQLEMTELDRQGEHTLYSLNESLSPSISFACGKDRISIPTDAQGMFIEGEWRERGYITLTMLSYIVDDVEQIEAMTNVETYTHHLLKFNSQLLLDYISQEKKPPKLIEVHYDPQTKMRKVTLELFLDLEEEDSWLALSKGLAMMPILFGGKFSFFNCESTNLVEFNSWQIFITIEDIHLLKTESKTKLVEVVLIPQTVFSVKEALEYLSNRQ